MLKAFFRIWILVFIPLGFLLFSESMNPIKIMNHWFVSDRVNDTFKGTFYLIKQRLAALPEDQWRDDINSLADAFGYELYLLSREQIQPPQEPLQNSSQDIWEAPIGATLSDSNRASLLALQPDETLLILADNDSDVLVKRLGDSSWWLYMMLDESEHLDTLNQSRGTLHLLMERFRNTDASSWSMLISQLQPEFGFELAMASFSQLSLSSAKQAQLMNEGMTWSLTDDEKTVIYQRLPDQQAVEDPLVLVADKIPLPGPELTILALALMILVGSISLGIFLFVMLLWRELNRLKAATSEFGKGNLQHRAEVRKGSMISELSQTYNRMADQIEGMIHSQRELTNAMAHDLRTPLSRVSFAFEMLQASDITEEEQARYRQSIASGIDTLDHLIQQILALSRYSRVADLTQFREVCFAPSLVQEISQCRIEHPELAIDLTISPALSNAMMRLDLRAMQRLVNNLLANACRYAASHIQVTLTEQSNGYLLKVEDDGPGIPDSDKRRVFEAFKQLNNEQREVSKEHGLGLAIVHQIIQWHNGEVWVEDSPLGGACFCVLWPMAY
ncbi:ATP-binding protein [Litoribrevibacter albus]|uniref:histidine kinase n=1 Tax=Litoribrevibacter albus TaxID=1473156 RepID=A0AA37SDA0_9GAMM|nr:ATP-binding protein [Litoribrevibacter albus]GLQ32795.1 hypothetical protein GCM10007876_32740 [Litoribrevibacter albus]